MTANSRRIAYITQEFPYLTVTFIYREIFALERKGFEITTCAIWKPRVGKLSEESLHFVDTTHYVFPISWGRFLLQHLYFLLTRPAKYLGTALYILTRKDESLKNRYRTLIHFGEAIYLAKELQELGIKHIHAHFTIGAASIALVISRLLDISFSFTAHNIFYIERIFLREKIRNARFIVAISEFSKQFLVDLFPDENLEKTHIVHCGLLPDDFVPSDPKPENDVPRLLFVAQLVERKGAPVLIEACRILAERGVAFRCVIVGDGPQRSLVEQLVQQYALSDVVELTGALPQEQVREFLTQADVFVLPCVTASNGDIDGIPVSLMESMVMEIPTVSTYVSGIPELIEDGQSGLLVDEKDETALADALQRLIEDEALRAALGKEGRQKVVQEFNSHTSAAQLAACFATYLN